MNANPPQQAGPGEVEQMTYHDLLGWIIDFIERLCGNGGRGTSDDWRTLSAVISLLAQPDLCRFEIMDRSQPLRVVTVTWQGLRPDTSVEQ
jgi:hypothetical protein